MHLKKVKAQIRNVESAFRTKNYLFARSRYLFVVYMVALLFQKQNYMRLLFLRPLNSLLSKRKDNVNSGLPFLDIHLPKPT